MRLHNRFSCTFDECKYRIGIVVKFCFYLRGKILLLILLLLFVFFPEIIRNSAPLEEGSNFGIASLLKFWKFPREACEAKPCFK